MKNTGILILVALLASSCSQELEDKNKSLQAENQNLQRELQQQDSLFNDFIIIQENLQAIRERETNIENLGQIEGVENAESKKEQILRDIEAINQLIEDNKTTMARMNEKMKRYSYEVGNFKNVVRNLKGQISRKDSQIVVLKERLTALNFEVDKLNTRLSKTVQEKEQSEAQLKNTRDKMRQAYYAIGTFKDLKNNEVLTKEGGIIGIGGTETLEDNFNKEYFTQIDLSKTTEIPLNYDVKDVELVSTHPTDSYEIIKEDKKVVSLQIKNAESFWKATRYLVIVLD